MELTIDEKTVRPLIDAAIHRAILDALGADKEKFLMQVIDSALSQKKDTYSRETIFAAGVKQMISEAGKAAFKEWINENRSQIQAALRKRIEGKVGAKRFADQIADAFIQSFDKNFYVSIQMRVEDAG